MNAKDMGSRSLVGFFRVALFGLAVSAMPAQAVTITNDSHNITGGNNGSQTATSAFDASNVLTFEWFDAAVTFLTDFDVAGGNFNITHESYFDNGSASTSQVSGFILRNNDTGVVLTTGGNCGGPNGPGIACDLIGSATVTNILFGNLIAGNYTLGLYDSAAPNVGSASFGVSAVPLPAAAWLFISALAGLGVFGRRRQLHQG